MTRLYKTFLLVFVFCALISTEVNASSITVSPGKFDRFVISMPDKIQAGEEVQINIQATDNLGNIIKNFNTLDKTFVIFTTGSATLNTKTLKASAFTNGVATVIFRDTVAEKVILSIREADNLIPLITKEIVVSHASLKSFNLRVPKTSRAGERFDVHVTAKDAFGNTYLETIQGKNLNISFKGEADIKLDMPAIPDLVNGNMVVSFMSMKTGNVTLEIKDVISNSVGASETIEIINGYVDSFKIMVPKEAVAGEPFDISIAAIDRFGNFVTDYSSTGRGINIKSSGKTIPFPSTVPAYEFTRGQARLSLRYDIAETTVFTVNEIGGKQTGVSEPISITLPKPDRFEITTPDNVVAGQKFKIKITVYNQNNKVIKNYNLIGSDVILKTSGSGVLVPDRIPATEFINGTAVVEVQYNKAESFKIFASMAEPTSTIKDTQEKEKTAPTVTPAQPKPSKKQQKPVKKKFSKKYELTNISIVESKKTSTLTAHINGMNDAISYKVLTEKTSDGKRLIVLKIKSTSSKIEKPITFESNFVKSVTVEEENKDDGSVLIKIEMAKQARFNVTKTKKALSIVFNA
ncbi:MAG: hypothetical protein N3A62_05530 [Thermodesulfovibrionales bacterium]|nr:hypothetical protein [Thermodesulfovibrionales bacterium]